MLESEEMSVTFTGPVAARIELDRQNAASLIDHTLLRPEASEVQIISHCQQAVEYGFATVFVYSHWLPLAGSVLRGTPVRLGTPVGFPYGAALTSNKRAETEAALRLGVHEVDMVMNIGALKSGNRALVESDIKAVVELAQPAGAIVKVILETALLNVEEKILACELSVAAGAAFVKTCTGFNGGAATAEDIALMRGVVGERAGVKAAGGIRTAAALLSMVEAGATRIGTSTGVQIIEEMGA